MTRFLAGALLLMAPAALRCQPAMPSWLVNYPGAAAQTSTSKALVEVTYTTPASPEAVQDHYRKLFEARNRPFLPNEDGIGVVVRASAECDLMLSIRASGRGSSVRVSCADNSGPSAESVHAVVQSRPAPHAAGMTAAQRQEYDDNVAKAMERHRQAVAEMGIHKERPPADAPPLIWPKWLVAARDSEISPERGRDPAGNGTLRCRYITGEPMTAVYSLYKDLLTSHGYSHRGGIETGHTQSGIQQNHLGYVEGDIYPDGFPGPRMEIHVGFSRMHLNDPITVDIKITAFAYAGSGPREP